MVVGKLVLVENTGSRGSGHYNQLTFINGSGEVEQLLITDRELEAGRDRASKNVEDLLLPGLWDRVISFLINLLG